MAHWLVKHRILLSILSLVITLLATAGTQHLWFQSDFKIFFRDDNPQLVAHEKIEDEYTNSDNILFVISPADGEIFSRETLHSIESLTAQAWQLSQSIRVDSITNYQHSYAENDDLIVMPLVEEALSFSDDDLQKAKAIALAEPELVNFLISNQAHATAVLVSMEMPGDRAEFDTAMIKVVAEARALRDRIVADNPNLTIYLQGELLISTAFNENSIADMSTLVPLMFASILILLLLFYRSAGATLATIAAIIASIATTIGGMAWLDIPLNQINVSAPIIIMTLAVCDAVHILMSYLQGLGRGETREQAMTNSLTINIQPVMLTSLTTTIGFLSLNFGDSPPLIGLGNLCAAGVMAAMIYSFTILPAIAMLIPSKGQKPADRSSPMGRIGELVIKYRKSTLLFCMLMAAFWMAFIPRNELSDNTVEYFHKGVPFRDAADFMQENLTGLDTISYSISCGESNCINDPEFLAQVDNFVAWYRTQPDVVHVNSYSTTMKRLSRVMHGDDPAWYRLPDSRDLAAQYTLLFEFSLPFGLDLSNVMNFDKSALKIRVTLAGASAKTLIIQEDAAQAWLAENYPHISTTGSSVSLMFAHIGQRNIYAMINGSLLALVLIAVTLMIALRSFRFGLLSMIPNAFPAAIAFGIWGLIDGHVNLAVAAVFSISLGIVVDDTVHFLSKYLRARREQGQSAVEAVRYAFSTVGSALVVTTIALASGFAILGQSNFDVNSSMGLMVALTIVIALIFDILFLPAMLLLSDRDKK